MPLLRRIKPEHKHMSFLFWVAGVCIPMCMNMLTHMHTCKTENKKKYYIWSGHFEIQQSDKLDDRITLTDHCFRIISWHWYFCGPVILTHL